MAKPFAFKLEKVLEFRRVQEDEAVAALARAQMVHDAKKAEADNLAAKLQVHSAQGLQKNPSTQELWLWRQYKTALEQDLSAARAALAALALKLQKCRQDALERSRDRKLLEKLKETQAARHEHEQYLKEQKEFDELAAIRHGREDI
ncbi:MAG: flagellar export protein FliJ [Desulfovibrionaceae bacterium]|jgi:flagellar FliJ protein